VITDILHLLHLIKTLVPKNAKTAGQLTAVIDESHGILSPFGSLPVVLAMAVICWIVFIIIPNSFSQFNSLLVKMHALHKNHQGAKVAKIVD
jgi:hypothetical protein